MKPALPFSLNKTVLSLLFVVFFAILYSLLSPFSIFAQCQDPNTRNEGLISATQGLLGNTFFSNPEGVCVTGTNEASYREFKVPSYKDLEDQFYTLNRSSAKKGTDLLPANGAWNFTGAGSGIYLQTNSVVLSSIVPTATTNPPSGAQVIFIRGSLDITGNIDYADNDSSSGLVFVVRDNINIYSNVTKVNAVLISLGDICTSYETGTGCPITNSVYPQPLIINGSLISLALNKEPGSDKGIKLRRNLLINTEPAEVIKKQPKYLYILRNGIFTKDLIITTEDKHYDIPGVSNPAPPPLPALPPAICTRILSLPPLFVIADDLEIPGCLELVDSL